MNNITQIFDKNKIDMVYLWVDGNDPEHKELRKVWQEKLNVPVSESNNDHKYVDHEELKYSLRSVMKNAPWIRKIFLVTNGQIPKWLDVEKFGKLEVITHEQIMPSDALPTFNSRSIEFCIANIPDLSEHFILANDDCFIHRPVNPSFFFTKNGNPIVRLRKVKLSQYKINNFIYNRGVKYSLDLIKEKYNKNFDLIPQHNMDAYSKTLYKECINEFKDEFDFMIHSKFRDVGIQRVIFALYMLVQKKCKLRLIKRTDLYKHEDSLYIGIDGKKMLDYIKLYTPCLLCLNDSCRVKDEDLKNYKSFLEFLYPEKQAYEKEDNEGLYPEVIKEYKKYSKKFDFKWKLIKRFKCLFLLPVKTLIGLFIEIQKDEKHKTFVLFNTIKIKIKRKKNKRKKKKRKNGK